MNDLLLLVKAFSKESAIDHCISHGIRGVMRHLSHNPAYPHEHRIIVDRLYLEKARQWFCETLQEEAPYEFGTLLFYSLREET